MSRRSMSRSASRRLFKRTGSNTRAINVSPMIMRGGYRM